MEKMTQDELRTFVPETGLGHLAMARDGHAYAIPVFFAFDGTAFYFQSHHGLKDEFAQATSEACLVITRADSPDEWASVQVFGTLEQEVEKMGFFQGGEALLKVPFPPSKGHSGTGTPMRSGEDAYVWSLKPQRWSGRKSVPRES
jgi:hypothetical protein